MERLISDAASLLQVIFIDLALSADNAVAVGLAAAALPLGQRDRAVRWGIVLALGLRIVFGLATLQLLRIRGLLAAGGALLFWIASRMWSDLSKVGNDITGVDGVAKMVAQSDGVVTFGRALTSIVVANIALSLDNVLAVAGVSRHAPWIMTFGLVLSVLLMGIAASFIARVVDRHRWIGYLGVLVIVIAGCAMIWDDAHSFWPQNIPEPPRWLGGA